jgi:hypothetical protein
VLYAEIGYNLGNGTSGTVSSSYRSRYWVWPNDDPNGGSGGGGGGAPDAAFVALCWIASNTSSLQLAAITADLYVIIPSRLGFRVHPLALLL